MLTRIALDGFKSFAPGTPTEIPLGPLTLLVGANASGKSNLLDAIRFLAGLGRYHGLIEALEGRWEGGQQVWAGVRGGASQATFRALGTFSISSQWGSLHHSVGVRTNGEPVLIEEALLDSQGSVFHTIPMGESLLGASLRGMAGREELRNLLRGWSVLSHVPRYADLARLDQGVMPAIRGLERELGACTFLELEVQSLKGYAARATGGRLDAQGSNLSAVLWQLSRDPELHQTLVDWVSELCAPRVEALDFIEVPETGHLLAVLVEEGAARITAQAMSDGTLRFLGLLAAAYSVEPGTTILIEEIENGLHPTRLHLLLELLDQVTRTRGIQVIATSHSPFALQALRPEVLAQAVVFGRHPDAPGTVARALGELPGFGELVEKRGIEHLFTSGWLEMSL